MKVILSTPMILEEGNFNCSFISIDEARQWVNENNPTNFVAHSTVRIIGVEPATSRDVCEGYSEALVLKVLGRVEFAREYTEEEIIEIGVQPMLITKQFGDDEELDFYNKGYI